jgi:hypothetical protein
LAASPTPRVLRRHLLLVLSCISVLVSDTQAHGDHHNDDKDLIPEERNRGCIMW